MRFLRNVLLAVPSIAENNAAVRFAGDRSVPGEVDLALHVSHIELDAKRIRLHVAFAGWRSWRERCPSWRRARRSRCAARSRARRGGCTQAALLRRGARAARPGARAAESARPALPSRNMRSSRGSLTGPQPPDPSLLAADEFEAVTQCPLIDPQIGRIDEKAEALLAGRHDIIEKQRAVARGDAGASGRP